MSKEIKEFLNDKVYVLVYRSNYDRASEANQKLIDYIKNLQQENKQLKDNWNKLREYVKETRIKEFEKAFGKRNAKTFKQAEIIAFNMVIDKIQELEKSDSNE